jgi:hypothetical protein
MGLGVLISLHLDSLTPLPRPANGGASKGYCCDSSRHVCWRKINIAAHCVSDRAGKG